MNCKNPLNCIGKQLLSLILIICMVAFVLPLHTFAAITYQMEKNGTEELTISLAESADCSCQFNIDGFAGKAAEDKIYSYSATAAGTGKGYFTAPSSRTDETHPVDSSVVEFSFLLKDDTSAFYYSPAFFNSTGYESFLDKGKVSPSTSGHYNSLNNFIKFDSEGVYLKDTTGSYLGSSLKNTYLCKNLQVGVWHTVAIKNPGLIRSVGETLAGEDRNGKKYYDGDRMVLLYLDGVEYQIPLNLPAYGTRHIKMHGEGLLYLDNITTYPVNQLASATEYKNQSLMPELTCKNGLVTIAEDTIEASDNITVSMLKNALSGADNIRVYETSALKKQLDSDDMIKMGNVIVASAKNGTSTEKSYRYYTVKRPLTVQEIKLTNADGKRIRGTKKDIENQGEGYYLNAVIKNMSVKKSYDVQAMIAVYDKTDSMIYCDSETITISPGETSITPNENTVEFKNVAVSKGNTLKAFLWDKSTFEPLCSAYEVSFDGNEEYNILAFGNSYSQDAFTMLPAIGKAAGIDIYAVNMYTGGCSLSKHNEYMMGNGVYQQRVEYLPDGNKITTEDVSFIDGLNTPGYCWDYISLQSRSVEAYDYTLFTPYITNLADFIRKQSPSSEVLLHQTWVLDTQTAKTALRTKDLVAGMKDEEIRPFLFETLKANYTKAAKEIGNPNRMVPVGEAINYAVGTLGFPEFIKDDAGKYNQYSRGMYRDTTCHLSIPCGRILAALCWYEYLTGNDARENPYQNSSVTRADMELLKQAAHYACSQSEYQKNN